MRGWWWPFQEFIDETPKTASYVHCRIIIYSVSHCANSVNWVLHSSVSFLIQCLSCSLKSSVNNLISFFNKDETTVQNESPKSKQLLVCLPSWGESVAQVVPVKCICFPRYPTFCFWKLDLALMCFHVISHNKCHWDELYFVFWCWQNLLSFSILIFIVVSFSYFGF